MDGKFHNSNRYKYLNHWVNKSVESRSWDRNEDLHLDEIDSKFKLKENWLVGSIYCFQMITEIIKDKPFSCLLAIQLANSNQRTDVENIDWDCVFDLFDLTPPSFYLFPHDNINFKMTLKDLTPIEALSKKFGCQVFFKEEIDRELEYFRCVYIVRS